MSDQGLRFSETIKDLAVCPKDAEGHAATVAGGKLAVREAGAGASARLDVVAVTGENRRPASAVVRRILQKEGRPGKGLAVLILFLHFQRSRPAEVVTLLDDRYPVFRNGKRIYGIVQLVALRRAELLILITAIEQAFKAQLAVCVSVALVDQMPTAVKEPEACAGKRGVLTGITLDDLELPRIGVFVMLISTVWPCSVTSTGIGSPFKTKPSTVAVS